MNTYEKSMITLKDIRKGHPFGFSSATDTDYVRIANTVYEMLHYISFCAQRTDEEMKRMAIKLTLYFEDIVSEIGLWRSFVHLHQSLYGKPLPFYYTGMGYTEDEPNIYDIQYLL